MVDSDQTLSAGIDKIALVTSSCGRLLDVDLHFVGWGVGP